MKGQHPSPLPSFDPYQHRAKTRTKQPQPRNSHEIVGVVVAAGADAKKFKVGDVAGVGTYVSSCRACALCKAGEEQFCAEAVFTYNAAHKSGEESQGGYSSHIVVDEGYAYAIAPNLDPAGAAPLLCAGITTYSPYVLYGLNKPGLKIGVVGIGGLVRV